MFEELINKTAIVVHFWYTLEEGIRLYLGESVFNVKNFAAVFFFTFGKFFSSSNKREVIFRVKFRPILGFVLISFSFLPEKIWCKCKNGEKS